MNKEAVRKIMLSSFITKVSKDLISGGLADGSSDPEFDAKQIRMGAMVELEHTKDISKAKEIARDHLKEDPKYYTRLLAMEAEVEEKKEEEEELEEKAEEQYEKIKAEHMGKMLGEKEEDEEEEELTVKHKFLIKQFLRSGKKISDAAFHGYAESIGADKHKAEEYAYSLVGKAESKKK